MKTKVFPNSLIPCVLCTNDRIGAFLSPQDALSIRIRAQSLNRGLDTRTVEAHK